MRNKTGDILEHKLALLQERLGTLDGIFNTQQIRTQIREIELQQLEPTFWNNQELARKSTGSLLTMKERLEFIDNTQRELKELEELIKIIDESSEKERAELLRSIDLIESSIAKREQVLRFDGPYDSHDAIVTIQSGAGGTDAQDWAQMLERMYIRYAEHRGWTAMLIDRTPSEEAGIKNAAYRVEGQYAYGTLRGEHGVHRLVRQSPYNSDHLRQTSFARVEILPILLQNQKLAISEQDLRVDTFRASGAGGQHVNKTSSAVRITHVPTGVVVQCQNQRSQSQNKAQAMEILTARLQLLVDEQHAEKLNELRGPATKASWGNQIRSYILHPYKLVKDHRTGIEVKNAEQVLDGDLSMFIESDEPSGVL